MVALATALVAAAALVYALTSDGGSSNTAPVHKQPPIPGAPSVAVISPRNGERQTSGAVIVRVAVRNFRLSPRHFGGEPELGEGHIRFQLHRVPNCIPKKRLHDNTRLHGPSFDYPRYAGPNGVLARRLGVAGSYSPATRPVIYYHDLPPGFYHMVINLADNNGTMTPFHGVTNFRILPRPGQGGPGRCRQGEVPAGGAAAASQE